MISLLSLFSSFVQMEPIGDRQKEGNALDDDQAENERENERQQELERALLELQKANKQLEIDQEGRAGGGTNHQQTMAGT